MQDISEKDELRQSADRCYLNYMQTGGIHRVLRWCASISLGSQTCIVLECK